MAKTDAERKRDQRRRDRQGRRPHGIDVGDDVLNTMEYLGWGREADLEDPKIMRMLLTRMGSDWAKANNPYL